MITIWDHDKTPYQVLGLKEQCNPDQIKQAHRRLAALHHPDRAGGSEEAMGLVNAAYALLTDKRLRREYDVFYKPKCPTCKGTRIVRGLAGFKIVKKRCPDCT